MPGAVDARCQPGEVASGPHHLVLRDLRAGHPCAGAPAVRSGVQGAVQQLLQRCGRPAPTRPARPGDTARPGHGARLAHRGGRPDGHAAGHAAAARRGRSGGTGPAARAAAPGADPHRRAAPAVVQPAGAGVPALAAGSGVTPIRGPAAVDRPARRPGRHRRRGQRLCLRQRAAAPCAAPAPVCAGQPAGEPGRVGRLHRRRRLCRPALVDVGRLGLGAPAAGRRATALAPQCQ